MNTALSRLDCYRNNIKGAAMTALINSLPYNNSSEDYYFRAIDNPTDESNILTKSQAAVVKAKGWIPQYYDYPDWKEYEGSYTLGDVNGNGGIDIGDAVTIVNFLVGKTTSLSRTIGVEQDEREPQ